MHEIEWTRGQLMHGMQVRREKRAGCQRVGLRRVQSCQNNAPIFWGLEKSGTLAIVGLDRHGKHT